MKKPDTCPTPERFGNELRKWEEDGARIFVQHYPSINVWHASALKWEAYGRTLEDAVKKVAWTADSFTDLVFTLVEVEPMPDEELRQRGRWMRGDSFEKYLAGLQRQADQSPARYILGHLDGSM